MEFKLRLKNAPWRSEMDLGEAGIVREWIVVDVDGKEVGKLVRWYTSDSNNSEFGLFVGEYPNITRIELPKGFGSLSPVSHEYSE